MVMTTSGRPAVGRLDQLNRIEGSLSLISRVLCFAVFFLLPYLGGNHLALPHLTIDRFWIETSFLLILIASIAASFLQKNQQANSFHVFLTHLSPVIVISTLSLFYTWNTYNSMKELNVLTWVLGAVWLFYVTDDKRLPLRALVWGSAVMVVCAVLQLKVLFPQLAAVFKSGWYASILQEKSVPFAAFLNENMFGGYLLLTLPISIFLGFVEGRKLHILTTAVLVIGVLISLSRLSLVVMALELLAVCVVFTLNRNWRSLSGAAATVAVGVLLFLLTVHIQGSTIEKNIETSFRGKASMALTQVRTLNLRTTIWRSGIEAMYDRPLTGYGAGTFEYAFRKYFGGRLYTRYSHGALVKIAVELGLLGIVSYLWYLFGLARGVVSDRFRQSFVLMSVAGGLLFSLVDCAMDTAAFVVTFFVISSTFLVFSDRGRTIQPKPVSVAILIVLLAAFGFTGQAGLAKKTVEEGGLLEEVGNLQMAADSYEQASSTMPLDNEPRIRFITALAKAGTTDSAVRRRLEEAVDDKWNHVNLKRDRDSELFFVNALANKVLGEDRAASDLIDEAIRLYPSSPYYVSQAVDWCVSAGNFDKAASLIANFEPFIPNIRTWGNPYGLYVYRLRELKAEMEFRKGNVDNALRLAQVNLESAQREEFVVSSYKTREYVKKEWLLEHLTEKVSSYRSFRRKHEANDGLQGRS